MMPLLFRKRALKESLVGTRGGMPQGGSTDWKAWGFRTYIKVPEDISSNFTVRWFNGYLNNNVVTGTGADLTVRCALEYPLSSARQEIGTATTFSNLTFAAQTLATPTTPIPAGSWVAIQGRMMSSVAVPYNTFSDATYLGDGVELGATTVTDKTMSGTINAGSGSPNIIRPFAVTGQTRKPAVGIFADSLGWSNDSPTDASGDQGILARIIGPNFAYTTLGANGDTAQHFAAGSNSFYQQQILPYCTHAVFNQLSNGIFSGRSPAAVLDDIYQCAQIARRAGVVPIVATCLPRPLSSSDQYATRAGQTIDTANEANRITVNNALVSGVYGIDHVINIAPYFQDATTPGAWITDGTPYKYVGADGIHPLAPGIELARDGLRDTVRDMIQRAY